MLNSLLKSVIEQDNTPIVICDLSHTIVYMNPAADENYKKSGGHALVGSSLLDCHNENSCRIIKEVVAWFGKSSENNRVHTFFNEKKNKDVYMIALRDSDNTLIGYYEKHEFRTRDTSPFYDMP